MNLSPRYNTSLSAISLVALPLLVAFAPLSQVVLAQGSGSSLSLVAQADRKAEADRLLQQIPIKPATSLVMQRHHQS